MAGSTPYHCPECLKPDACGYNGVLVFVGAKPPLCRHNEKPGKTCHEEPVRMVTRDGR